MSKNRSAKFIRAAVAIAIAVTLTGVQACSSQSSNPAPPPITAAQESAPNTQSPPPPHVDSSEPDSVLGAGAHFVWTVVAFPVRVVGDVLGLLV
jgi:hypothetical protein